VEGTDGGSGPVTSRRSNGRRIRSSDVKVDWRAADPGGGVEAVPQLADLGGGMERAADSDVGVELAAAAATVLVSRCQRKRRLERDGRRRHPSIGAGGGNARWRPPPCGAVFLFFSIFLFFLDFFPFRFPSTFSSYAAERVIHLVCMMPQC